MEREDYPYKVERAFIGVVARRADIRGFGKGEFASKLWPWMQPKVAATRWSAIRERAAHTGKPQNVTLADAQRIADVLGEELSYLLVLAKEEALKNLQANKDKGGSQ